MSTNINIKKKLAILEEGASVTTDATSIDFVGSGVNASTIDGDVTVTIPGNSGNTTYYLNESVTQAPYKEFSSIVTSAVEQVVPLTVAGGTTSVIAEYQTPSGIPGTTQIPGGLWQFFLHFNAGAAGQNWIIRPTVYKRDLGGTETLLFTPDPEIVIGMSTTTTMYVCDGVFPAATILTTDRIVVRISMQNTTGVSQTVNFRTEGSQHYSVGLTTLNQVIPTGAVTSVTGTAPIVSSGGLTPAISIPQSSATVDGYLSSSDWSVFNAKVPATRNITINGTTQDLSADRTWTIATSIPQANTIYVDSVNGVNALTGRGDINTPYLTVEYVLSNTTNTGTITGNTSTVTSTTITGISDANNANLSVGQNIGGAGIPFNTIIIAKGNQGGNANTITISKPATATATGVTITWITSYVLVLSGNFTATSNWFKQGMFINAQVSNISWSGFTLFNNTTAQIMSYALLGNGNYYGASAANTRFFNYLVAQTSEFICNINYDNINTNDTGAIFNGNIDQGQLIIKGNLARANFGSITSMGNTYITFYSSTYGLTGGHSIVNQGHLNLVGGFHQTPASVNVLSGSISYFNTTCTLIGSTNPQAVWNHVGGIFGTTINMPGGSLDCYGNGTIYASAGAITGYYGNVGNLDLVVSGNVELNGDIRGAGVTSGRLINNGSIGGGVSMTSGTFINKGHCGPIGGAYISLTGTSSIYNYGYMNVTLLTITGGLWENRGTMELTAYGQATSMSGGTFRNYGLLKNVSKNTDIFQLSGTGVIENYGTIQNTNVNTTSAIIKKSGGTLKLFFGSILKVANGLSPIWCVNNDAASKDIYMFNCVTNCNGTTYGLGYAFPTGFVPNDLVGGVKYENTNY